MSKMQEGKYMPAGYEDDEKYLQDKAQRLSIKVVPDITVAAGINGADFNCKLNLRMEAFFLEICDTWKTAYQPIPSISTSLKILFLKEPEPLLLALKLYANCPGSNNFKNKDISTLILQTVCKVYKEYPDIGAACDDNTRMVAFSFVKTCGIGMLIKDIVISYELEKIRDLLMPKILELLSDKMVKEAAQWVIPLNVTQHFGIFEIVVPLILQDRMNLAEEYLDVAQEQQLQLVKFLDSLLDKKKSVETLCFESLDKNKYDNINYNNLTYRVMSKLLSRLAKKYKINQHLTPNLNYSKACSYIHYLHFEFHNGKMSSEAWREMVCDTVNTKELQMALLLKLTQTGDLDEALYWATYYNLSSDECPYALQSKMNESFNKFEKRCGPKRYEGSNSLTNSKPAKRDSQYLKFNLPYKHIIQVDSEEQFLHMLDYLEKFSILSFDSEWKPTACNEIVAILQMATFDRVFLIDCLSPKLYDELWKQLGRRIFNNLEILKLGFALHHDLRILQKSLPMQLNMQTMDSYLDLSTLWRQLKCMNIANQIFDESMISGSSLCALAQLCLGKKLDKSNQCSNWSNRPLRYDQVVYAALDAYCLLQIYRVLDSRLELLGFNILQIGEEEHTPARKTIKKNQTNNAANNENMLNATQVKFLCDHMLVELSNELRKLGIDCIDASTTIIHHIVREAKRDQRYVLTNDWRYDLISCELPKNHCVNVPAGNISEQVLYTMNYYRLTVKEENLFTRCLLCNRNEFIRASRDDMFMMRFGQIKKPSVHIKEQIAPERAYKFVEAKEHILNTKTTLCGKSIKFYRIKPAILYNNQYFYICDNCGTCTWNGAHKIDTSILNVVTPTAAPTKNQFK